MPQAPQTTLTNNFTGGLKTEFTGLNFPENSATDTQNCIFTLVGNALRREGIDYEAGFIQNLITPTNQDTIDPTLQAISTYKWNNVNGDGRTQIIVLQVGNTVCFFQSSSATTSAPLSTTKLISTINLFAGSAAVGTTAQRAAEECQYADGNGYLFIFHPYLNPIYCTYSAGTITMNTIFVLIRDFDGVNADTAGLYSNTRPAVLTDQHLYNLINQGWDLAKANTFNTAVGKYPSNSDVWWNFKSPTNVFDPATTNANVTSSGPAPKGSQIISAFDQVRSAQAFFEELVAVKRPKTGTWFQGRVWYTGVDAPALGAHIFSENIYFSQIIISPDQFGFCYQVNNPTSEKLFDLLPTDGGVIHIQGSGSIYKLFPVQNGLIVFAANGVWFITGSQGIGFSANDYTVTKLSGVQNISSTSYINVMGYPLFWNEEGIYSVSPDPKGSGLLVDNLCIGTILSYYANIPLQSKKFAKGDYNPLDYVVQWVYRSTNETSLVDRYHYNRILCYNISNKAFYVYTLPDTGPFIADIRYVAGPGGSTSPDPAFKYIVHKYTVGKLVPSFYQFSFAEEYDDIHFKDWFKNDNIGIDYNSYFVTGYRIHGQGTRKWQPGYLYMYASNDTSYKIQNIWDYAINSNSGKYSTAQIALDTTNQFGVKYRRHRLRGHGLVNQIKVSSIPGKNFNIHGWTVWENQNTSV